MTNIFKNFLRLAPLLAILALAQGAYAAGCPSNAGGYCVNLAAVYPGLEFLGDIDISSPGELLAKIYIFGISLVGISALIMLVVGGVMYLTAIDSPGRLGQARSYMGNALLGLVLALLSWLILFTINPDLILKLKLDLPQLIPIEDGSGGVGQNCPSGLIWCEEFQKCTGSGVCTIGVACISDVSSDTICVASCPSGYRDTGAKCCLNGKSYFNQCQ